MLNMSKMVGKVVRSIAAENRMFTDFFVSVTTAEYGEQRFFQRDDGTWYDKIGTVNFVDNKIDKDSGSVSMRAVFDNPKLWLVPGDYMKVKLIAPQKVQYITVPQACTKGDAMSGYYVWAVKDGKAVKKNIEVSDDINTNWIVEDGVTLDDTIVVSGIQNISMEGQKLKTVKQTTDTSNTDTEAQPTGSN